MVSHACAIRTAKLKGKCKNASCKFLHDKSKVAVCKQFIQGLECTDKECMLQHGTQNIRNSMPVCVFFLKGVCTNPNCMYLHAKVNSNAALCPDFQKLGYCPRGPTCKLKHEKVRKSTPTERGRGQDSTSLSCGSTSRESKVESQESKVLVSPSSPSVKVERLDNNASVNNSIFKTIQIVPNL
eukprot:TRINITY_DN1207_c0_g1_i1.p1 TRINITY_DN1207_c0_g1~~TRINITY_DN1207_c0_g1_i1.p1  ORF type:complete len:183 (-),score=5.94 TRINITY_DN1207_c0_g1_i1:28-576(-)